MAEVLDIDTSLLPNVTLFLEQKPLNLIRSKTDSDNTRTVGCDSSLRPCGSLVNGGLLTLIVASLFAPVF